MFRRVRIVLTVLILLVYFVQSTPGQTQNYTVSLAPFSTLKYDEFSPVYYKNGIVFCTNQSSTLFMNYTAAEGPGFIKIFFIDTTKLRSFDYIHIIKTS